MRKIPSKTNSNSDLLERKNNSQSNILPRDHDRRASSSEVKINNEKLKPSISELETLSISNSAWKGSVIHQGKGQDTHRMILGKQPVNFNEQDRNEMLKKESEHFSSNDPTVDQKPTEGSDARVVVMVCYGPKGSFYIQFNDHSQAWDNIPQFLHSKLENRRSQMPPLTCLSISDSSNWLAVFADGSFATSGFSLPSKLRNCLSDSDSQPLLFKFAPHDGWILVLDDGSIVSERLPTTLEQLLSRRSKFDAPICELQISGHGGWFVRFSDGECEWEGLPSALEKLLIANIRKIDPDEHIVVTLSVCDGLSYFAVVGDIVEWVLTEPAPSLRQCLEFAQSSDGSKRILPESVFWHAPI